MKASATFTLLFISLLSFSQTNLSGEWYIPTSQSDIPLGYNFLDNGDLIIYEAHEEVDDVYKVIQGSYYYEDGSDLLVTITWYGDQAKTTKFNYSFDQEGKLVLEQTYPEQNHVTYEREGNLADL